MSPSRIFVLTLIAVMSFASNSLLCRFALKQTHIDAATFTFVRIFSGATTLWIVMKIGSKVATAYHRRPQWLGPDKAPPGGTWFLAIALIIYTAAFTFAYNTLSAGTGALLLFGAVQVTMIFWGLGKGETLHVRQLIGLALALTGLVVLLFPGLSAPPLGGSALMLAAGIAWGIYSLGGKGETNPAGATAGNFLRAVPLAFAISIAAFRWMQLDRAGVGCAIVSGAITSGLAYIVWYTAVANLRATSAATVQLSVPVLAATGGILLLGEPITLRYVFSSLAVLGGIALVVATRARSGDTVKFEAET